MPGENVSFIAYGQDHTDKAAMLAVQEQLVTLHQELQAKGQQLVIGIEHSEVDVKNTSGIREMHNRAVMQIYLEQTAEPSYQDFLEKRGDQLIKQEQHPDRRPLTVTQDSTIARFYKEQSQVWDHDVNKGKGQSQLVEAAILDWADLNKATVTVRGLDPVTDAQKRLLLTKGTGTIDGAALQAMEYERVQGMGKKSAEVMRDLADTENGGCLVALNMGTAHLCSIEVVLRHQLETQGLQDASVTMCALVGQERMRTSTSLDHAAQDLMYNSVRNMQNTSENLKAAAPALSRLRGDEKELQRLERLCQGMDSLPSDETEFRALLREQPEKIIDTLEASGIARKTATKVVASVAKEVAGGSSQGARELVNKNFGIQESDLKRLKKTIARRALEFEKVAAPLSPQETEELFFAQKVHERLNNRPGDVFKVLTPGPDGGYNLQQSGPVHTTSTRDSLSVASSSSSSAPSHHLEQGGRDVGPSTSGSSDNSTRAHFKRSGSLSSLGGDTSTTLGTATPKVHAFK